MKADKRSVAKQERRTYWRRIVEECGRSGRGIRAFCRERQVKEHLFYRWRRALEREAPAAETRFLLVSPEADATGASNVALELVVEHGWRLRIPAGADAGTLRAVLGALAAAR